MNSRSLAITAAASYLLIFFAAIFANFLALEQLTLNPLQTMQEDQLLIRLGIIAFLITAVADIIVAWALYELYKKQTFILPSTLFRMTHAIIMGIGVFALVIALNLPTSGEILHQVNIFNTIWLIGLFFFGFHLILLAKIIKKPKFISFFLILAGAMYIFDTVAHFTMSNYESYATFFLLLVAIPSIVGEMSFTIWLFLKGGK